MNEEIIRKIYSLLIKGNSQKKIVSKIRRDKSVISRVTKALVRGGFIVCINHGDRVLFYEATKKPFLREDAVILSTVQQEKQRKKNERGSFCRVHAIRFISTVEKMGKVPWDKKWVAKEVEHYFLKYPFLNIGEVGFEWVVGKEKNQLIIHLPSLWWRVSDGNPLIFLRNMADNAGTWFMKRFKCDLRGLRQCGKGHFEVPVHDEKLTSLAQATSIRMGDFILDSSLGYPEFGSEGFDALGDLFGLIPRVESLENRMDVIEKTIIKVVCSIEKLQLSTDKLLVLFEERKKEDDYMDVT